MPTVIGPVEDRRPEIITRVAALLNVPADDVWVAAAVDSAIEYTLDATNRTEVGLPDSALTVNGLVIFAQRLYLDTPNGVQVAVGDPSFDPIFQPEHLWKHVRHYFDHLDVAWGIGVNLADLTKLIHDGLVAAGKVKIPVVPPGTPVSVLPCIVLAPGEDALEDGNRTLRYGFNVTPSVPRSAQVEQYELLVELEAIVIRSLRPSPVRFDGPFFFRTTGPETGEAPALARVIPVSFATDVDLC